MTRQVQRGVPRRQMDEVEPIWKVWEAELDVFIVKGQNSAKHDSSVMKLAILPLPNEFSIFSVKLTFSLLASPGEKHD